MRIQGFFRKNRFPRWVSTLLVFSLVLPNIFNAQVSRGASAPVVSAPATITMPEGGIISFRVTANDPDGDAITSLTASPLPTGASLSTGSPFRSGMFGWSLGFDQAGEYDIVFMATSGNPALSGTTTTHIVVTNLDRAPGLIAPATIHRAPGTLVSFTVAANDPDGDTITSLTAAPLPVGATFTANAGNLSGTFSWTPSLAQTGTFPITFTASNSQSGTATSSAWVTSENSPPIFDPIPEVEIPIGGSINLPLTVRDEDLDDITVYTRADDFSIEQTLSQPGLFQGNLQYTSDPNDSGGYLIMDVCAYDSYEISIKICEFVTIHILPPPNHPPVLAADPFVPSIVTVNYGETLRIPFAFTDEDGDSMYNICTNGTLCQNISAPFGERFADPIPVVPENPAYFEDVVSTPGFFSGTLVWTPREVDGGVNSIEGFCAYDGHNDGTGYGCRYLSVRVPVIPSPEPPVAVISASPTTVCTDDPVTFDSRGSYDPDGFLTRISGNFGDGQPYDSAVPAITRFKHSFSQAGTFTSSFTVFDNYPVTPNSSAIAYGPPITVVDPLYQPAPDTTPTYQYGLPLVDPVSQLENVEAGLTLAFLAVEDGFNLNAISLTLTDTTLKYIDPAGQTHTIHPVSAQVDETSVMFFFSPTDLEVLFNESPLGRFHTDDVILEGRIRDRDCNRIIRPARVLVDRINLAPILASIGPKAGPYRSALPFTATATDPNFDTLAYTGTGYPFDNPPVGPNRAVINPTTGAFSWTPRQEDVGDHQTTICVSDGLLQDCETITVTVETLHPTAAFTVTPEPPVTVCTGDPVTFDSSASADEDGTIVQRRWRFGDGEDDFANSAIVQHSYAYAGNKGASLVVKDNSGNLSLPAEELVHVVNPFQGVDFNTLLPPPQPPGPVVIGTNTMAILGVFTVPAGTFPPPPIGVELSSFTWHLTTQNGDISVPAVGLEGSYLPADYYSEGAPEGLYILARTSLSDTTLLFESLTEHVNIVTVRLEGRITNLAGCNRVSVSRTLTVVRNHAPTIQPLEDKTIYRIPGLVLPIIANDPDGDPLTFRIDHSIPDFHGTNTGWNENTHTFTWRPCAFNTYPDLPYPRSSCLGTYTITFTAIDQYGLESAPVTIRITVLNTPPVAKPYVFSPPPFCAGKSIWLTGGFDTIDPDYPDGLYASVTWKFGDGSPDVSRNSPLHIYTVAGTYYPALTIIDLEGASNSASLTVDVHPTTIHSKYSDLGSTTSLTYKKGTDGVWRPGDFLAQVKPHQTKDPFNVADWDQATTKLSVPALSTTTTIKPKTTNTSFTGGPGILANFSSADIMTLLANLPTSPNPQTVKFVLTGNLTSGFGCDEFRYVFTVSVTKK